MGKIGSTACAQFQRAHNSIALWWAIKAPPTYTRHVHQLKPINIFIELVSAETRYNYNINSILFNLTADINI
jgi:hypothetical protein